MQAAVLAHGIAEGQLFVEGNKRIALAACLTLLGVNGHDVVAPQAARAEWIPRAESGPGGRGSPGRSPAIGAGPAAVGVVPGTEWPRASNRSKAAPSLPTRT